MRSRLLFLLLITLPIVCVACSAASGGPNVLDKAAAEATAIIQQAEATAMVVQARAMATAMIEKAGAVSATPVPAKAEPTSVPTVVPTLQSVDAGVATIQVQPSPEAVRVFASTPTNANQVQVMDVGFGVDGRLIMVRFKAPPKIADQWWQGRVSVVDEATGTVYNEIPVTPLIGPLIGRPKIAGQIGYVMLVNTNGSLHSGSIVTVVLGDFKQEHVTVAGKF